MCSFVSKKSVIEAIPRPLHCISAAPCTHVTDFAARLTFNNLLESFLIFFVDSQLSFKFLYALKSVALFAGVSPMLSVTYPILDNSSTSAKEAALIVLYRYS